MTTNTNLTPELAQALVKQQSVLCPNCQKAILTSRWKHKNQFVEFQCSHCGEVYRPCKLL